MMPRTTARLLPLLLLVGVICVALAPLNSLAGPAGQSSSNQVFLPVISVVDTFGATPGLWAHASAPATHEVLLLRCTVPLAAQLSAAELAIFADTRYEAWLNGTFIGRGPARFSKVRREFDQIQLGDLAPGSQTLAVLAQWAPNLRRSESVQPQVQLRLGGRIGRQSYAVTLGPDECRALRSGAWNARPTLIHAWDILGPSEQLDLRLLPESWNSSVFNDSAWPRAVIRPAERRIGYQPRSIPPLASAPITATVTASGSLAQGFWVGELVGRAGVSPSYQFSLTTPTTVTLRALESPGQPLPREAVTLNGTGLEWSRVPGAVPDLRSAQRRLPAGQHRLSVSGLGPDAQPWVFAISRAGISSAPPPLGTGNNPGRRMLIPDLTRSDRVNVTVNDAGIDLVFGPGPSYAILDLGRTVHGRLVAEASGPAGTVLDIGWDERLWRGTRPLPHPGSLHPEWSQADSWTLDAAPRTLTTIDARAGRYVLIASWSEETVSLRNLRIHEERYPVTLRGAFASPNDRLNRIWMVGVETLYPSMLDAYADPWRERGQWWGDAHIADHVNRVAFGELGLLRRGLMQMADSVNDGPPAAFVPNPSGDYLLDYSLLWVQGIREYDRLAEDRAFLAAVYPQLRTFMAALVRLEHPETGLIDMARVTPPRGGAYIDSNSYWDRRGQTTALNAYYYRALLDAAAIAANLGEEAQAVAWTARAAQLRDSANRMLYVPSEGRYVAGIFEGNATEATPQAQAAALAFGLAPDGEEQRVADAMLALLGTPERPGAQVLGMFNVLEGLGRTARVDDGVEVISRFFGSMLDRGATTWWENFQADQSYTNSLSHAWGGSPTWFLSTYVLGARRTGPSTWEVTYSPSSLSSASGTLPLGDGEVNVRWSAPSCRLLTLVIDAPAGSSGVALVPSGAGDRELQLNGSIIWANGRFQGSVPATIEANQFRVELGTGLSTLQLRRTCQ